MIKITPTKQRIAFYVIISIIIIGAIAFLIVEFTGLPNCKISNTKEAADTFLNFADGVDEILESYGLQCEPFQVHENEYNYRVDTYIYLENGDSLYIMLDYDISGDPPPEFRICLYGKQTTWDQCHLDLKQYPFMYDIIAYLSNERFSVEQYQAYFMATQDKVEKRRETETQMSITEHADIKSAFFELGSYLYAIKEDGSMYYPTIVFIMSLYN